MTASDANLLLIQVPSRNSAALPTVIRDSVRVGLLLYGVRGAFLRAAG